MASVLRVKRKRGEEKLDALLISCKKRRTNGEEAAALETEKAVFTFAGTVKEKHDGTVVNQILSTKEELQAQYKSYTVDIAKKVRENTKQQSCQNRYKIVNSLRQLDKIGDEESEFHIVDIEDVNTPSDDPNTSYEYDLYYINNTDLVMDDSSTVLEEMTFGYEETYKNIDYESSSEDSNSESNATNDYGDSDSEDELVKRITALTKHSDSDSSSSDEDFIYDSNNYSAHYKSRKKLIHTLGDSSDLSGSSVQELSDYEGNSDDDDDKDDLHDYY